ncbi:MAG: phosphate ABC transporter permease subunit PstC [Candidatus Omnitrophota bacterium]
MKRFREFIIEKLVFLSGILVILFVGLIFVFLLKEAFAFFREIRLSEFLAGKFWYPISDPPRFGILPLILGSLFVTLGAVIFAVPLSVGAAFYIAEIAPARIRDFLKTGIEVLASIPSVVLGFVGMMTIVPWIKLIFHVPTGLTALAGSVMLGFMAMPTIISISEDAITAVPRQYKEGSIAIGATRWQTMYRVTIHAAKPGIIAACMLGVGRVIGETMAVMMITGNAAVIPRTFLQPVRTLTATIAAEMGEVVHGSMHYYSLFSIGVILFLITFIINVTADFFLHRQRTK